jgi:hypothetical protein
MAPEVHETPLCVASRRPSRAPGAPVQQPNKPMKLTVAFGARSLSTTLSVVRVSCDSNLKKIGGTAQSQTPT